jgi:hypothetical protein
MSAACRLPGRRRPLLHGTASLAGAAPAAVNRRARPPRACAPRAPAPGRRDFRPALAGCTVARKIALLALWLWSPRAVIMCSNSLI